MNSSSGDVTALLRQLESSGTSVDERFIEVVYCELRRLAGAFFKRERLNHTLQPTALVNEAYLRLVNLKDVHWRNRSHFFAMASTLMRNILVDYARAQQATKRGGEFTLVEFEESFVAELAPSSQIIALNDALNDLARLDPRQSRIIEMRFFAGLDENEIGEILGISSRTVKRDWRAARAWLYRELSCPRAPRTSESC